MTVVLLLSPVLGLGVAWGCWLAADYLVRFASTEPLPHPSTQAPRQWLPALVRLVTRAPFSVVQLAAEIVGIAFFVLLGLIGDIELGSLWMTIGFIFFLLTAIIDFKYRLVLNIMVYPAVVLVTATRLLAGAEIMPLLLGGGLAFGVFYLTARLSELGSGDIKLALLLGVFFGFPQILWALLMATGVGALIAVSLWIWHRNAKLTMPYAPFLCFGAMLAMLYNPIPTL
ncbi:MAG: hypothetical protein BroJett018_15890 [Chloroflexota bacterium]|nr:prepilin peptidase [Chloroflexota bacterium]NOG65725.1 prepilin peptidase [Chloroflexota bacterium]GIK63795.1 MAG: hypothetical protein BroJett018_15890 [Chloroflexota bacterium]